MGESSSAGMWLHVPWNHKEEGAPCFVLQILLEGQDEELPPSLACILLHSIQIRNKKSPLLQNPALEKVLCSLGTLGTV